MRIKEEETRIILHELDDDDNNDEDDLNYSTLAVFVSYFCTKSSRYWHDLVFKSLRNRIVWLNRIESEFFVNKT